MDFSFNKLKPAILIVLVILFLSGCSKRNAPLEEITRITKHFVASKATLLAITNGASYEDVTNALKDAVFHEFTVTEPDGEYMALGCRTSEDFPDIWLLTRNNILIKVISPIAPEMESYPYQGTTASRLKSWGVTDMARIDKTVNSKALTYEQTLSVLSPERNKNGADSSSVGDIMGGIVWASKVQRFNEAMALRVKNDYIINQELTKHYDGCRVKIGMGAEEVVKLYGEPVRSFPIRPQGIARIFGDSRNLEVSPVFLFSYVAVVFDSREHVKGVYSHDFFNDEWKKPATTDNK